MLEDDETKDVAIHDNASTSSTPLPVNTILDGSVRRLAVDATISADESPTKYQIRQDFDTSGTAVPNGSDTSLFIFTGTGLLDFVGISGSTSSYTAIINIDGVEQIRISMSDLSSLGLSNATNLPTWADTANKNYRFRPYVGSGFGTSFEILVEGTGPPNPTVNWIVTYREKV